LFRFGSFHVDIDDDMVLIYLLCGVFKDSISSFVELEKFLDPKSVFAFES
jgi:hypothetical protein